MFDNFSSTQLQLIYLGLKSLIESGSGYGFHNSDMGHPVYRMGSQGKPDISDPPADSPEKNTLFKMLSELTKILKKQDIQYQGFKWWYDFSDWQKFCQFVVRVFKGKIENH